MSNAQGLPTSSSLNPEEIVEQSANEIVMKESAKRSHHER